MLTRSRHRFVGVTAGQYRFNSARSKKSTRSLRIQLISCSCLGSSASSGIVLIFWKTSRTDPCARTRWLSPNPPPGRKELRSESREVCGDALDRLQLIKRSMPASPHPSGRRSCVYHGPVVEDAIRVNPASNRVKPRQLALVKAN